ncbi:hypothetical protein E2562_023546 [Oryza meyeriana var. granulata]|uniref:Bowman-Birk serine protease inhibitors family domain-containing protein n=1 Tax=Oryza meyeriana var. granulata TaxID=110450 RepID=A0A6G1DZT7_9ORYZ|nr:hypothetical protein E2562_023546 [Oryza meyeriana var. granulata]
MKMKTAMAASILLFFLLASLAAATRHTVSDTTNNIRLPSDVGGAQPEAARPWDCCDNLERSLITIFPPFYRCNDEVEQCAAACQECVEAPGDFPRGVYVCNDWYQTADPGPFCTERPWGDCCDTALCTKTDPPTCRCADEVEACAAACKECEMVESSEPPRYVCQDRFTGQPGPSCTPDT